MSTELQSTPAAAAADPVTEALSAYAATLRPEAVGQLSALWADLRDQPSGVVRDLVSLRIGRSEYDHFRIAVDPALARAEAARQGMAAALKQSIARAGGVGSGAPGLAGTYGKPLAT